jgi:hypothetical protein
VSKEHTFSDYQYYDGPTVLPVFDGYTVDMRLLEFRKVDGHSSITFVDFESEEGDQFLCDLIAYLFDHDLMKGRLANELADWFVHGHLTFWTEHYREGAPCKDR